MFIYRNCIADTVLYNTSFTIIHFNWNDSIDEDMRCYCSMALLNLTISTDVLKADVCKGINSKINCEDICEENNDNILICGVSHNHKCNIETKKCLLYGHEQYIPLQSYLLQVFVVMHGIACDVIGNHDEEICRGLFNNNNTAIPTGRSKCSYSKRRKFLYILYTKYNIACS